MPSRSDPKFVTRSLVRTLRGLCERHLSTLERMGMGSLSPRDCLDLLSSLGHLTLGAWPVISARERRGIASRVEEYASRFGRIHARLGSHLDLMASEAAKAMAIEIRSSLVELGVRLRDNPSAGLGWAVLHYDIIYPREKVGYAAEVYRMLNLEVPSGWMDLVRGLDRDLRKFLEKALPVVRRAPDFVPNNPEEFPTSFWWISMLS